MSECQHTKVVVWTTEQVGRHLNLETKEWGDYIDNKLIEGITVVYCADCRAELKLTGALLGEVQALL